jgi:hypothetical protein
MTVHRGRYWAKPTCEISGRDLREAERLSNGSPAEFDPSWLYGFELVDGALVLTPLRPRRKCRAGDLCSR